MSGKPSSNSMILVPLYELKFLNETAASGVGTSTRRHSAALRAVSRAWEALYRGIDHAVGTAMTIDEIIENFALLDDWDDRYRYVIELGRSLPPLPPPERTEANKGAGLRQPGWLASEVKPTDQPVRW